MTFLQTVDFLLKNYTDDMKTVGDVFGNVELQNRDDFIKECYNRYGEVYNEIALDKDQIKKIIELSKENMWFSYLFASFNRDIGWIDFEKEISFVVKNMKDFLELRNEKFMFSVLQKSKGYIYILKSFGFFFQKTKAAVIGGEEIYDIKQEYLIEYPLGSQNIVVNNERIIEKLYNELENLGMCLKLYLSCFVENTVEYIEKNKEFERCEALRNIDYTITFNYTNTFEKAYLKSSVYHLHGSIDDRIILGVNPDRDDDLENVDTSFVAFKKYYQRTMYETDVEYIRWISELKNRKEQISLLIMGHSLDITDADIIQELFEQAKDITILYHDEKAKSSYISNLIQIFGKAGLEDIRKNRKLTFLPLDMDFAEFNKKKEEEAWEKIRRDFSYEPVVII